MRAKDVANQYGLSVDRFESFLQSSGHKVKWGIVGGWSIENGENIDVIVTEFKFYEAGEQAKKASLEKEAADAQAAVEKAAAEKKVALANMLITSGFNFDGYTITKYSGYISGDDAVSVERGLTIFGVGADVKDKLLGSLVRIRRNALAELREAAYALGCNAVIGVDFDYLTLDPQTANLAGGTSYQPYIFGVTANGNAVVIERNDQ